MTYYELYRTDTHNIFGEYDSLEEVRAALKEVVALVGPDILSVLMLSEMQEDGYGTYLAGGSRLLPVLDNMQILHGGARLKACLDCSSPSWPPSGSSVDSSSWPSCFSSGHCSCSCD